MKTNARDIVAAAMTTTVANAIEEALRLVKKDIEDLELRTQDNDFRINELEAILRHCRATARTITTTTVTTVGKAMARRRRSPEKETDSVLSTRPKRLKAMSFVI